MKRTRPRLPANVVQCRSADGTTRYGAKVKFAWMKNQLRCGSNYVDPESASRAANLFQSASRDASDVTHLAPGMPISMIVLDQKEMGKAMGVMCNIYVKRSTLTTQAPVVDIVRTCVEKVNSKLRRKLRGDQAAEVAEARQRALAAGMGMSHGIGGMGFMGMNGMNSMNGMHAMGGHGLGGSVSFQNGFNPQQQPIVQMQQPQMHATQQPGGLGALYSAAVNSTGRVAGMVSASAMPATTASAAAVASASQAARFAGVGGQPWPSVNPLGSPATMARIGLTAPATMGSSGGSATQRSAELQRALKRTRPSASSTADAPSTGEALALPSAAALAEQKAQSGAGELQTLKPTGADVVFAVHKIHGLVNDDVFASDEWLLDLGLDATVADARASATPPVPMVSAAARAPTQKSLSEPSLIVSIDEPSVILDVNAAWLGACGYTREEVVGKSTTILHGNETEKTRIDLMMAAIKLRTSGTIRVELTNYTKQQVPFTNHLAITQISFGPGTAATRKRAYFCHSHVAFRPQAGDGHPGRTIGSRGRKVAILKRSVIAPPLPRKDGALTPLTVLNLGPTGMNGQLPILPSNELAEAMAAAMENASAATATAATAASASASRSRSGSGAPSPPASGAASAVASASASAPGSATGGSTDIFDRFQEHQKAQQMMREQQQHMQMRQQQQQQMAQMQQTQQQMSQQGAMQVQQAQQVQLQQQQQMAAQMAQQQQQAQIQAHAQARAFFMQQAAQQQQMNAMSQQLSPFGVVGNGMGAFQSNPQVQQQQVRAQAQAFFMQQQVQQQQQRQQRNLPFPSPTLGGMGAMVAVPGGAGGVVENRASAGSSGASSSSSAAAAIAPVRSVHRSAHEAEQAMVDMQRAMRGGMAGPNP